MRLYHKKLCVFMLCGLLNFQLIIVAQINDSKYLETMFSVVAIIGVIRILLVKLSSQNLKTIFDRVDVSNTSLRDCPGMDIKEVETLIDQIKNPAKYEKFNVCPTKGILLIGLPGTGKTSIARAIAGEIQCPCFVTTATRLQGHLVGLTDANISNLFLTARRAAAQDPSKTAIIFVDEIDAVGNRNNNNGLNGLSSSASGLSTLLDQMDGFNNKKSQKKDVSIFYMKLWRWLQSFFYVDDSDVNIVLIAATNKPESIDEALKRSGRFDYKITVDYPNLEQREKMITYYLEKCPHNDSVFASVIARLTDKYSPADIKLFFDKAKLRAIDQKRNKTIVTDFCHALFQNDTIISREKVVEYKQFLESQGMCFSISDKGLYECMKSMSLKDCKILWFELENLKKKNNESMNIVDENFLVDCVAGIEYNRMESDIKMCREMYGIKENSKKSLANFIKTHFISQDEKRLLTYSREKLLTVMESYHLGSQQNNQKKVQFAI